MSAAFVAVQGCALGFSAGSGSVTVTSVPSPRVKADGKGVFSGGLDFMVSGYSAPGISGGTGAGTVPAGARKTKADGAPVVLAGDSVTVPVSGSTQSGSPVTVQVTVKVQDAGQSKVKCS